MVAATGWTWGTVVEEMDIPRLAALNRQWSRVPPIYISVAGLAGWKGEPEKKKGDLGDLVALASDPNSGFKRG